ncbi:unnamed protein product [Bursaphelenchus xylophilus]|uniref:Exportin-2 n=1 Tax=Bursaphelenchus xylophilus TaxID=6326 RepID=A0A1I7RX50_BURXY|nr:unnamed protein product [Bursaphelenchus xylophilus]CAG9121325.1 unnamed protein product [Bursaphelenchus xylophilus]
MAGIVENLPAILQASISPSSQIIKQAEQQLEELSKTPGFAEVLLQVINETSVGNDIKIAAAVAFKNFIRNNWNPEGTLAVAPLEESERERIRQIVISGMFQMEEVYRRQLSQALCIIGTYDFPHRWENLMEILAQNLTGDFTHILASLTAIEQLVHRYRKHGRSDDLIREIIHVLKSIAQPITDLFKRMVEIIPAEGQEPSISVDEQNQWLEVLLLLSKIYYSLIWQDLPEFFEDHLEEWMTGYLRLLALKLPTYEARSDSTEPNNLDNLKRVICDIAKLFSQRFEEEFLPYIMKFIEIVWNLLVQTDHRVRFDLLVNAALGYLSAVCERERYGQIFREPGVLEQICQAVVIKNLTLRQEDLEQFEDEPFDYLKRDIEGLDLETRRRGAVDFVRALTKYFENDVFNVLGQAITQYLNEFQSNPTQNWIKKDVVYFLVSALASKSTTARQGATSVSQLINIHDFYNSFVRPELVEVDVNSYPPILIADALNFVVLFRNQLDPQVLIEAFGKPNAYARRILGSDKVILHHFLGYAFDKLATVKKNNELIFNSQTIPAHDYLEALISAIQKPDSQKSHYLMKAFMRCLSLMDQKQAESANVYVDFLVRLIEAVVKESQNPMFTHLVFESLCVVIKKSFPYIQEAISERVMPLIEQIISADLVDFVPYSLQIVALLLYQSETEKRLGRQDYGAEKYESFFPHLVRGTFWQRVVNAPALTTIFEAFIKTAPDFVLRSGNVESVMGCYQSLISSRTLEENGFRLATALIPHYDTNPVLTTRGILLPMLNRYQTNKTQRFTRIFVLFLTRLAYIKGAERFAHVLNEIQPGMVQMVVDKVLLKELRENHLAQNYDDKRHIVLGLASLIGDTYELIKPIFRALVECSVDVVESTTTSVIFEKADEDLESEAADVYCKLTNIQSDPIIPKDIDVKKFLAQMVQKAISTDPSAVDCLPDKIKNTISQYAV